MAYTYYFVSGIVNRPDGSQFTEMQTAVYELNQQAAYILELERALKSIKDLSDDKRGGDIYIKMQKVNKHATDALGK